MNAPRLFRASCVALIVTAMSFAIRGDAMGFWTTEFNLTNQQVGLVSGTAFWGFTLAMLFGGPLVDWIGLGRLTVLAFVGHAAGIVLTMAAWDFWSLFIGTLLFGVANGTVEAVCNPLIATLYPNDKTTKLNHFHVWFPGGIVIGGLVAYFLGKAGIGWRMQFGSMLIPLAIYGFMFMGQRFPRTERVESGVSTGEMWMACLNPLFIVMVIAMLMTAASELGPNQWIPSILQNAGVSGILVLVWINGLMAVGRQFAGTFVHRLSAPGMLVASAILTTIGLYALSKSSGYMLFAAATVFALGVCFFWPTMLGTVSERFPKTGALGLAIMGGAGMLSVSVVLPIMGRLYDSGIAERVGGEEAVAALGAVPVEVQAAAGLETIGKVAILPAILTVVFVILYFVWRKPAAHATPEPARATGS